MIFLIILELYYQGCYQIEDFFFAYGVECIHHTYPFFDDDEPLGECGYRFPLQNQRKKVCIFGNTVTRQSQDFFLRCCCSDGEHIRNDNLISFRGRLLHTFILHIDVL